MSDDILKISIHALREESDGGYKKTPGKNSLDFNPRSPRGERPLMMLIIIILSPFQSTLSARRATLFPSWYYGNISNFNPRSPRGERQQVQFEIYFFLHISIHALREESDHILILLHIYISAKISIHALREESDLCQVPRLHNSKFDFNPRSPRGERPEPH